MVYFFPKHFQNGGWFCSVFQCCISLILKEQESLSFDCLPVCENWLVFLMGYLFFDASEVFFVKYLSSSAGFANLYPCLVCFYFGLVLVLVF